MKVLPVSKINFYITYPRLLQGKYYGVAIQLNLKKVSLTK